MAFSLRRIRCAIHSMRRLALFDASVQSWPGASAAVQGDRCLSKKAKKTEKHKKHVSYQDLLAELGGVLSLTEAEDRMKKSIEHFKSEMSNIRVGRATPGMLDHMTVDATTGPMPLKALGTITVKDSHLLSISLFDAASSASVQAAIEASPLRLQSKVISEQELHIILPKQTHETLEALAKVLGREAEHSKTTIRSARKIGMSQVKQVLTSEDDQKRGEKAVDALTESYVEEIETLYQNKRRELRGS